MNTLAVILTCVDIVVCIALIVLVMSQEGNDQGMGVVGGSGNNSFYEKSKGRTMDEKLKKITLFTAILFAILTTVLFLVLARGF
ncbi:MAG: preprotein translocase subunit SecG [Clostridiales bacterium]|nr:preprotein translocase subunit SecG [Clostridiales bacterium]